MRTGIVSVAAIASLLASAAPALAADEGALFVRGSVVLGSYTFDDQVTQVSATTQAYGLGAGTSVSKGDWLADFGIDVYRTNDNKGVGGNMVRTDVTLTGGYRLLDWLTPFAGVRAGSRDDSKAFGDHYAKEGGVIFGAGIGPYAMTESLRLSFSLAYNANKIEYPNSPGQQYDYNGGSFKARLGFAGTGHALELRHQKFTMEQAGGFSETFACLAWVYNWKAGTF